MLALERTEFSLTSVTDHTRALAEVQARSKGISFEMNIDPAVPKKLIGAPLRLRQLITNLLNNALKFTERGEVRLSIKPVLVTESRATLRFEVSDTGPGIPEHIRDRRSEYADLVLKILETLRRLGTRP